MQERALLDSASKAAQSADYETAMLELKKLLADNANHELALGMLGGIYGQLGMHERAIETFTRLLRVNPHNPLARFQLGLVRFSQGDMQQALSVWEPLLSDPSDFMAHFHSGLALLQRGAAQAAQEMFRIAEQRMPPSHPLYSKLQEFLAAK